MEPRICGQGHAVKQTLFRGKKANTKRGNTIMKKEDKKYRRSGISVACYVLAAAMLVYVFYLIGGTVQTINEYYGQYGINAQPMEYITYSLQAALQPIVYTVVFFMLGYILDAVRMNNKDNYKTDEEIREAVEAKKQAKEAKKLAKGEAAAIKAGNIVTDEESVEADFARSLDEELRADGLKTAEKKAANRNGNGGGNDNSGSGNGNSGSGNGSGNSGNGGGNRKPRSNNNNRSDSGRNNSGRSGSNAGRKRPEGGKNDGSKSDGGNGAKNDGNKNDSGRKEGGSGKSGGNGGQRRSSNRKPADKPKLEDATKTKAEDGFEVLISEPGNKE